ncbi:MAG TPA: hypothetical protein EYH05_04030, partial [Anaerolineae bacterium]|nr:hypothetical protein [Anaerolineae bacterium]
KKFQELADKYKKKLETERLYRMRLEVAAKNGLPPELAARLQGSTIEELEADAATLTGFLKPAGPGNLPRNNSAPPAAPTEAQMRNPAWVREHIDEIWQATKQ